MTWYPWRRHTVQTMLCWLSIVYHNGFRDLKKDLMMVSYCQKVQKQFASRHTSHTIPCLAIRLLRNIRAAAAPLPIRHLCNATLLASNRMSHSGQ